MAYRLGKFRKILNLLFCLILLSTFPNTSFGVVQDLSKIKSDVQTEVVLFTQTNGYCPRISVTGILCGTICGAILCPCCIPCIIGGQIEAVTRELCCTCPAGRVASDKQTLRTHLLNWKGVISKLDSRHEEVEYTSYIGTLREIHSLNGVSLFDSEADFRSFMINPDLEARVAEELPSVP